MNYKTQNDDATLEQGGAGTWLQGYIDSSYDALVQRFGEPMPGFDKTDAEWVIKTEEGTVATIYNWKNGINYNGRYGTPTERITRWHIGGTSKLAVIAIREIMGNPAVREAA